MSDKQRLPFALLDGALSGLQSVVRTMTGLARAPLSRGDGEGASASDVKAAASPDARKEEAPAETAGATTNDGPATDLAADTATSPFALAAAIDEKAQADLVAHGQGGQGEASVIDSIPRADGTGSSHSGHEQPAPDEELGPEPFTPQVGP